MQQDEQSITADWQPADQGYLCEAYRSGWNLDQQPVDQVFQAVMQPGAVSCWHSHAVTTDRLFVSYGMVRIVLYDARKSSPTHGQINEFRFGSVRPATVSIPPGVWHGIRNEAANVSIVTNIVDHAYQYEKPDHFRLPPNSDEIPYDMLQGISS